ncbi:MAG: alanine--glyoxylate aminotransferase family protein [Candidatus Aminicenantes bacterium]|nr:alanine--glyoxylate aminotransferase family protein [Candidatus Aminicenantes bacterium]
MSHKLLLIPGPSPVVPRILDALARPTVSHVGADMAADVRLALDNLKKIVFCASGEPFLIAGAGTLSMEVALLNLVGRDERVLVLSQGYFGDRMGEICESFGLAFDILRSPWGEVVPADSLARAIQAKPYGLVAVTHVDTSTGGCAPVRAYAEVLRDSGILYVVDGVCATGGVEERMDDWGIDVVLTAAQKCFGAPPGLAVDVFSERAMAQRRGLPSVPAYYADILRWLPIMKEPTKYFSTPGVNEMRAFAEATKVMLEEGMESRFTRHALYAEAVRAGLEALGFSFFTRRDCWADTLSVVNYPEGVDDKAFRAAYFENGCVVAGGLGATAGKVFRMGHMGNLTADEILFALEAMERALESVGGAAGRGASVRAAERVLRP